MTGIEGLVIVIDRLGRSIADAERVIDELRAENQQLRDMLADAQRAEPPPA